MIHLLSVQRYAAAIVDSIGLPGHLFNFFHLLFSSQNYFNFSVYAQQNISSSSRVLIDRSLKYLCWSSSVRKCKLVWYCINVFMSDYILIWFSSKMNTSRIQLKCHFCRKLWNRYDKFIIQAVNSRFWKYTSCNSILVFRVILMSLKHTNKTSTLPSKCNQWAFTIIITCFLWRTHTLITWLKFRMKIWGLESLFWRLLSLLKWKTVMN